MCLLLCEYNHSADLFGGGDDLFELSLDELRNRRDRSQAVENTLSYVRRLIHGRLDIVRGEPRRATLTAAVNDSFGFGGHNMALVFTTA